MARRIHGLTGKFVAAAMAVLFTAVANAAPVSVVAQHWFFNHASLLQTAPGSVAIGDAKCSAACDLGWTFEQQLTNDLGSVSMRAHGDIDTYSSFSDTGGTWGAQGRLEASASVDPDLVNGRAIAEASLFGFLVAFEVTESVLFTGSHGLEGFATGTILQPGIYFSMQQFLPALRVEALAGETVHRSLTRGMEFNFAAVPAPPALLLMLCGIAAIFAGRTLRRR